MRGLELKTKGRFFFFFNYFFINLHGSWAQFFNICVNIWVVNLLHEGGRLG